MTGTMEATSAARPAPAPRAWARVAAGRLWSGVVAVWAAVTGLAPHVLHHVGPLAGAALLAGAGGKLLFAAIGFVVSIPFLLRLRRRFATWKAPAVALAVFAAVFTFSTFVVGPLITGSGESDRPGIQQPAGGHMGHHH